MTSPSARLIVLGVALGLVGTLAAGRLLRGFLFGVTPGDPLTTLAALAAVLGAASLACNIPARRAARIDPMTALRRE
jgi:putative ABC transport system permease protein